MFGMFEPIQRSRGRVHTLVATALLSIGVPAGALAQTGTSPSTAPPSGRVTLPTVTVTAQKEPADPQELPVSVTTVPFNTLQEDDITAVSDAGIYSPNTYFTDFTARKLSNARVRGIGSSPANPAVTTYIDGVPQLNANSSSIEFLDVNQVEFVRGAQSALFGRNTLGGLINISSGRPSVTKWTGQAEVPFGNFSSFDLRASAAGPIGRKFALGLAFGHAQRDGFTVNDITGHDLDSRDATFGKAQLLWTPTSRWETRLIVSGERARDGDYALGDLAALRANPYHVSRDFEGHTNRDVTSDDHPRQARRFAPVVLVNDGFRLVEDQRFDGSRLHAAAARDAQQRREGLSVHAGGPRRVSAGCPDQALRQRHVEVAGRRLPLHTELRPERGELVRAVPAVPAPLVLASINTRRRRRSTMAGLECTGRAR